MGEVFLKLLNMSITAGWLILAVFCVRILFRKMPKWINCVLWGLVALRLMIPFSIESPFSLQPSAEPIKADTIVQGQLLPHIPSIDSELAIIEDTVNPMLAETFAYEEAESVAPLQVFTEVAGNIWLGGMIVLFIFAMGSMVRLRLMVRESLQYKRNVYLCDAVKSPFILGIIKPVIFLPSGLSEEEMDYILAHERAHMGRGDHLWKPVGYLLLCVYWFNPLCWLAYMMLCKDIELACDEKVIKNMNPGEKKGYSRVLLACATQRRLVMKCPLAFGEVGVKERVKSVLSYKKPAFWITTIAIVVCAVVTLGFLTNPSREYEIRITIPAGSMEQICYSDEEICPKGNRLTVTSGVGLGDTEVVLLPVEVKEENTYEPTYMTPGMPVKIDVEKGAWFKIGVNMQNPTTEDIDVYVNVRNVEIRIESEDVESDSEYDGSDSSQEKDDSGQAEVNAALQDLAYYLELSAPDIEFRNMSEADKEEILSEYGALLEGYSLMARESRDGKSAYIAGFYNGDVTQSPLYEMQSMYYTHNKSGYQILYLQENYAAMDRIKDEQGVMAITDEGYVIQNSELNWRADKGTILIHPMDTERVLWDTFVFYHNPGRGRAYIEDALYRGIGLNNIPEPYLSVYMISDKYGEITEKIPLSEERAAEIMEEEKRALPTGEGFAAALHIGGEFVFYAEGKGVPQSIIELAVEKCGYQFAVPADITAPIKEARLECSWLEETRYLEPEYMQRLEQILKEAKYTGVGNCGYGAKLTVTLEGGQELIVFKGTDDCGSLVFGSYGGYQLNDKADGEFWEMFGLAPGAEERFQLRVN